MLQLIVRDDLVMEVGYDADAPSMNEPVAGRTTWVTLNSMEEVATTMEGCS